MDAAPDQPSQDGPGVSSKAGKPRRSLRRRAEATVFDTLLDVLARLSRPASLEPAVLVVLRGLASAARRYRRASTEPLDAAGLGREWQRMMPNPKVVPITRVEGDTAFAEIRVRCPLRGTGDVRACHRMMAYDRALVAPAGGRFVVLRSQAEPGVTVCEVAIRPSALPAGDLEPAHERVERLRAASGETSGRA